jgi:hypothetical protein
MARRYGLGGGVRPGLGSGGTSYNPNAKPSPKPTSTGSSYITPPFLSFDPAIEAQRREAARGLEDTEADTTSKQHFAKTDLTTALREIHRKTSQSRQDINRSANRGEQKLGYQEADTQRNAGRQQQDFQTGLANIARQFGQQAHRQAESANAAGVLDQGTLTASAAARAGNQRLAEAPIHTAQQRSNEDLATALGRIGTARGQITQDRGTSLGRLNLGRNAEREGAKRSTGRTFFESNRDQERARREEQIKNVDLLAQEIYAARAEHPQVFANWKQVHPEAIAKAEGGAGNNGGGTSAPGKKTKKKGGH